jgi:hypothetical protein
MLARTEIHILTSSSDVSCDRQDPPIFVRETRPNILFIARVPGRAWLLIDHRPRLCAQAEAGQFVGRQFLPQTLHCLMVIFKFQLFL